MATVQGNASMPLVELPTNFVIKFEAIDPTSGAAVSGVSVENVTMAVDSEGPVSLEDVSVVAPFYSYVGLSDTIQG